MIGELMNFVYLIYIGFGEMGVGDGFVMVIREGGEVDMGLWRRIIFFFESLSRGYNKKLR